MAYTNQEYADMAYRANTEGKLLVVKEGKLVLEDVPVKPVGLEELAYQVRTERDHLISKTDFLLMPDYPISPENLEVVKQYRQALRDISEQEGFPQEVVFPEVPTVIKNVI